MKAILERELTSYFNTMTGYAFSAFLLLFAGIYTMSICLTQYYANFEYVLGNMAFIFMLIVPILTMKVFAEERNKRTDQLLYSLPLSMGKIVLGKYIALLGVLAVPSILIGCIPVWLSRYGQFEFSIVYATFFGFILLGAALLAIGMFISSLTESQPIAAALSFVVLLINYLIPNLSNYLPFGRNFVKAFALFDRLNNFTYGILDITDIIVYISVIVVFVFLTIEVMERRRDNKPAHFVNIAMAVAAALILNYGVALLPANITSYDVTSNDVFSISDETKDIIGKVDKKVTIYYLAQKGTEDDAIVRLIREYKEMSDFIYSKQVDPVENPNFSKAYTADSINNNSLIITIGDDEASRYIDYYDIYDSSFDANYDTVLSFNGESAITTAINAMYMGDSKPVYYLTGHGELNLPAALKREIKKQNMKLEELSLVKQGHVPEDAEAIIIYSPQSDLSSKEADELLDYAKDDGSILLLSDVNDQEYPNLYKVTKHFGLSKLDGIIFEGDANYCMSNYANYLIPEFTSHTITDKMLHGNYQVVLPFAHGITIDKDTDALMTPILHTSKYAYNKIEGIHSTTGKFEKGDMKAGDEGFTVAAASLIQNGNDRYSYMVWIGTTYLTNSEIDSMVAGSNTKFVCDSLSWMCDLEDNVTIGGKEVTQHYLSLNKAKSRTMTIILVFVLPAFFILSGLYTALKRRKL